MHTRTRMPTHMYVRYTRMHTRARRTPFLATNIVVCPEGKTPETNKETIP